MTNNIEFAQPEDDEHPDDICDELNSIRLRLGEWVLHDVPFGDDDLRQIATRILALCAPATESPQ